MTAPLDTCAPSQQERNQQAGAKLREWAWRGGTLGNYVTIDPATGRKRTHWTRADKPDQPPRGLANKYFGLHPVSTIPATDSKGKPAKPEHVRSRLEYIEAVNLLYAEFDSKDFGGADSWAHVATLAPAPSVIAESSPGCYHCYWLLADTYRIASPDDLERAKRAQAGWVNHVGGDKGAKDLTRILRIPGTYNCKPERQRADGTYPLVNVVRDDFERVYTFEELEALALPCLTAAEKERSARRAAGAGHVVTHDGEATITPALQAKLDRLPQVVLDKLHDPGKRGERSGHDYNTAADLVREGFTDADLLAVFSNFPIGTAGKFSESGLPYLLRTIAAVRDAVQPAGPDIPTSALLSLARQFVFSADGITYLRERGIKRAADTLHMLAALVNLAHEHNAISFGTSLRKMAEAANLSKDTVRRRVEKLAALDIVTADFPKSGARVTLSFALRLAADSSLCESETPSISVDSVSTTHTDADDVDLAEHWQACNVANDLYTAVQYRHGIARRVAPSVLLPSLGPAALPVVRELRRGAASVADLADVTGLSVHTVKSTLHKLRTVGLAHAPQYAGRQHAGVWALVEGYDDQAAAILPETTGYGTGLRNAELHARIAAVRLHDKMHFEADPAERLRLRDKWLRAEEVAQIRRDLLAAIGIKPAKASSKPRPFMRWDKKEQDAEHRHAWEAWRDTQGIEHAERCRMMHDAGYSDSDIKAAKKIDRWGDHLAPAADFMDTPAPDAVVTDSCAERPQEAWGWA